MGEPVVPTGVIEGVLAEERNSSRRTLFLIGGLAAVPFLTWFEGLVMGAVLITPLESRFLWAARAAGFFITFGALWMIPSAHAHNWSGKVKRAALILFCSLMGMAPFNFFAWHAAHFYEFAGSDSKVERAIYPILAVDRSRS